MATFTHKRGDTFQLLSSVENEGVAVDITNYTIASQARDSDDTVLQTFTVTKTDAANGIFTITATAAQTELWAPDRYSVDIEFTAASGEVSSTETFTLNVVADITRIS